MFYFNGVDNESILSKLVVIAYQHQSLYSICSRTEIKVFAGA
ncbi:hypothetical protein P8610_09880 [Fictibacillus sp. UD]